MSETIKCEITNVKMFDNRASISIKPLKEMPEDLANSKSYNQQYGLQFSHFVNEGEELPSYAKEKTKVSIPYYINPKGYMSLSKYDEVKVLEESKSNVVDDIKKAFPNTTVENMKDDLQDEGTDFDYGTNNPYAEKAQCMQQAFQACKDKEFFEFFGRDLDALQKLVVTVFLSNR